MKAIEMIGRIEDKRHLFLDGPVPISGPSQVRVIILVNDEPELDEKLWLRAAAENPVFDFLEEPEEDIYSLKDGTPFHDKG